MHAHVSYLTDECPACLLMLTVERDAFFELSASKEKIVAVRTLIYLKYRYTFGKKIINITALKKTMEYVIYFRALKKQGQSKQ